MSVKTKSIGALFVALVIILAVNPKVINNIYGTILGRLFLICIVIFFAMNNTTLGLLVALAIITASNQFGSFVEGMDNQEPITIGDDNSTPSGNDTTKITVMTKDQDKQKLSDLKQNIAQGVDKEDIKAAIASKDSKQIPVDSSMNSSGEVSAASSAMLTPSSATLEGFTSYAPF